MRKRSIKNTRVNTEVQHELSNIIRGGLKDPRVAPWTSVVAAEVAPDLKTCKAYISVLGDAYEQEQTIKGLQSAEGYIRRELARTLNLRNTPEIKFVLDQSIEYGVNMSKKIDEVTKDLKTEVLRKMLNKVLENVSTIAIGGHVRPDGDCVGSCVGLGQYIRENYSDKTVDIYLKDIPESFHFLKGTETILESVDDEEKVYDFFISLDCGDTDRLEYSKTLFNKAKHTFCVDHHISNIGFADVNHIVPEASSTSELVYGLLDEEKISQNVAEALYLGIVHDTGVFQYSCAGPETFRVAANLLEKGIDGPKIIEDTFYAKSYAQNLVMGRALMESILFLNGTGIASYIRRDVMDFYGVGPKDLEGIVSQLRVTEGVEVAVFMYELKQNEFKVSLRSKEKIDVSKIAQYFGGGGHKKASGFTMAGTPFDVLNNLSKQIEAQMEKLEKTQEQ